eukprot:366395-Chlamydomonas_euryale.AAC.16
MSAQRKCGRTVAGSGQWRIVWTMGVVVPAWLWRLEVVHEEGLLARVCVSVTGPSWGLLGAFSGPVTQWKEWNGQMGTGSSAQLFTPAPSCSHQCPAVHTSAQLFTPAPSCSHQRPSVIASSMSSNHA